MQLHCKRSHPSARVKKDLGVHDFGIGAVVLNLALHHIRSSQVASSKFKFR